MPEESYSFAKTRIRLEEIVTQVRKKDTSLERSLDLLEEGVRLANQCTELIDHADWEAAGATDSDIAQPVEGSAAAAGDSDEAPAVADDAQESDAEPVQAVATEPGDHEQPEDAVPTS